MHDDFAELGGDSLLGAQIVARINESFPLASPLVRLVQAPTVDSLAEWLIEHETEPGQTEKIAADLAASRKLVRRGIFDAVRDCEDR